MVAFGTAQRWVLQIVAVVWLALPVAPVDAQQAPADSSGESAVQPAAPPRPPRAQRSPAATMNTFLEAMSADEPDYEAALACLDLDDVPEEARQSQAIKLYGTLIRIPGIKKTFDWPDADEVASDDFETWTFFPWTDGAPPLVEDRQLGLQDLVGDDARIELAVGEDRAWRFAAETVAGIDSFYGAIKREPVVAATERTERDLSRVLWFEDQLPPWMLETVFGLKYWQWIGLLLLIFTGIVLDFLVRLWIRIVSIRVIARRGGEARDETLKKMVRPFGLAAMALFWLWVIRALDLPPEALLVLMPAVRLFMILAVVWALFRVTDLAGEVAASKAALTDTKFDDLLIPLVRKTVKIFITVFGLIYIADSLHISIVPLLTGLGIGGVGFAFAAKDTLENLFGSVTVIADRPFQVGDWVAINDTEGIVEEVGFRSTRVRTFYNSLVTIPNGNLVRAVVDNYGRRKYRRWSTHITITYDTKPDTIEAFCEGIRELIRLHPYTRKDYYQVWLHQFGAHSLDVLVYVFWEVPDWQTELRERHRLMSDIIRLADRLGVEFAFPTQTLHVYEEQPGDEHTPEPPPEMAADFRAMRAGREAVRQITSSASWRERKPGPYRFKYAGDTEREDTDDNGTQIESRTGGDA